MTTYYPLQCAMTALAKAETVACALLPDCSSAPSRAYSAFLVAPPLLDRSPATHCCFHDQCHECFVDLADSVCCGVMYDGDEHKCDPHLYDLPAASRMCATSFHKRGTFSTVRSLSGQPLPLIFPVVGESVRERTVRIYEQAGQMEWRPVSLFAGMSHIPAIFE